MKMHKTFWIFVGILAATTHAQNSPQPATSTSAQSSDKFVGLPDLDPAFIPTKRVAPPEHVLQEQLHIQLDKLKAVAKRSTHAYVTRILSGEHAQVCDTLWNNLQNAEVPKFTHLARTLSEKKLLFEKLKKIAEKNQDQFSKQNSDSVEKNYLQDFKITWKRYDEKYGISGLRRDGAYFAFMRPDNPIGTKRFLFGTLYLDYQWKGLSIRVDVIGKDGVHLLPVAISAISMELFLRNHYSFNEEFPSDLGGLLTIGKEIVGWQFVDKSTNPKYPWWLILGPIWDGERSDFINCSVKFN